MARNKRPVPEASPEDLALFASFVRSQEQAERDAKRAARDERKKADEHTNLVKAKEEAASLVKRLRASDRATAEQKAEADAAYKAALAAVVAAETGEAPSWAPPAPEPEAETGADVGGEAATPDGADALVEAEPEAEAEAGAGVEDQAEGEQ